jgi:hypothetical protein
LSGVREFQIIQCLRCKHIWDDMDYYIDEDNPGDECCPCILYYGNRTCRVLSEGVTNTPKRLRVRV